MEISSKSAVPAVACKASFTKNEWPKIRFIFSNRLVSKLKPKEKLNSSFRFEKKKSKLVFKISKPELCCHSLVLLFCIHRKFCILCFRWQKSPFIWKTKLNLEEFKPHTKDPQENSDAVIAASLLSLCLSSLLIFFSRIWPNVLKTQCIQGLVKDKSGMKTFST